MFDKIEDWFVDDTNEQETKDLKFSEPASDGVIYLLDEQGNETTLGIQTYDSDLVRLAQLVNTGMPFSKAQEKLKYEKRNRKLKSLLKDYPIISSVSKI